MDEDANHLNLLRIFHIIMGVLVIVCSTFGLIYVAFGIVFVAAPPPSSGGAEPPPAAMGAFFVIFGLIMTAIIAGIGVLLLMVAKGLNQRKWWMFILVMSGINCMNAPLGTALGVFTIIVLLRPSVKHAFGMGPPPPASFGAPPQPGGGGGGFGQGPNAIGPGSSPSGPAF